MIASRAERVGNISKAASDKRKLWVGSVSKTFFASTANFLEYEIFCSCRYVGKNASMIAPIIEDLAQEYDGQAVIAKINTDENLRVASELGIMGIPTLILFREGAEVDRVVGFAPRKVLEQKLVALLN